MIAPRGSQPIAQSGQTDRERSMCAAALESAPDAMMICRDDGSIVLVNAQAEGLFGYNREEILGRPVEVFVPDRLRAAHGDHRGNYHRDPRVRPMGAGYELVARRRDGTEFPAEISLAPVTTPDGAFISVVIRDITARKAIETALRAANRELEVFSDSVAHDLRAPLRGMRAFAERLLETSADRLDAEGLDNLREIVSNARRMGGLVDALHGLTQVSLVGLHPDVVDLSAVARAVARDLSQRHPEHPVAWTVAEGLTARVDPHLARSLFDNLLGNAWKFTRHAPSPRVEVGVTEVEMVPTYFVRDNGVGFDMASADSLFAPFRRLHAQDEYSGTGVGLATVQRIVHRHGGTVHADARVNEGATFFFTLGACVRSGA